MGYTELDSILGQPLPQYVINQLRIRSEKTLNSQDASGLEGPRDNDALVYTGNKTAWIRVVSSIDLKDEYKTSIYSRTGYTVDNLAKNFVLFGGTSAYFGTRQAQQIVPDLNNQTNDYVDKDVPNYQLYPYFDENLLDKQIDQKYGFRPMVGITSAKITTQGKLGSILQAEIDFKVNTKTQLDIVDILYFKLGYTMFVEWGNTFFYKQKNPSSANLETYPTLQKSEDYAVDPFEKGMDSEKLQIKIAQAIRQTEGNYDAMVGIVTNFNFSMNTEGGYDCKIKIMGKGLLAESMRANAVPSLPEVYKDAIKKIAELITSINKSRAEAEARKKREDEERAERERIDREKNDPTKPDNYPPCIKQYLDVSKMKITTLGSETYAEQVDAALNLADHGFFGNPGNRRYFKKSGGTNVIDSTYECNGVNIVDAKSKAILGTAITSVATKKTDAQILDIITNNKPDPRYVRFSGYPTGDYDGIDVFVEDYLGEDKSPLLADERHYYIFTKFKTIVYLNESLKPFGVPFGTLKFNLNTIPSNLGTNDSWFNVLINGERTVESVTEPVPGFINYFKVTSTNSNKAPGLFSLVISLFDPPRIEWEIEYASGTRQTTKIGKSGKYLRISFEEKFVLIKNQNYSIGVDFDRAEAVDIDAISTVPANGTNRIKNIARIEDELSDILSRSNVLWQVENIWQNGNPSKPIMRLSGVIPVSGLPYKVIKKNGDEEIYADNKPVGVKVTILTDDFSLLSNIQYDKKQVTSTTAPATSPSTGTATAGPLQYTYETVSREQLQDSEAALYKSQLEAMLRTVQMTTISDFMNASTGEINEVKYIDWTDSKHSKLLYNIFEDGALGNGHLKTVITNSGSLLTNDNIQNYYKDLEPSLRYQINLYCGFHRGLMKDNGIDQPILPELVKPDSEYRVRFGELLRSYVVPYYQNKNLVEGGDIHYPTYVTLGYFFMMLNHCSFLYNTTAKGINIPIAYLDFNQGSNIILSSDFMLSANPYRFIVPFRGNLDSYKKLFSDRILTKGKNGGKGDEIIAVDSQSKPTKLWTTDALSKHLPPFKFTTNNPDPKQNYRGKLMNALVSIDYLLDVIKIHATRDETNSVYVRSLLDEILSDLGKSLGNYNVLRLAYDDYANCFYVVDDQSIPGDGVQDPNIIKPEDYDLPVFGKKSIAKAFTIQTDNSSKLASQLAISANSEVNNQSTAGIDATSVGNSSLYAVDRYKKALTTANDNIANNTGSAGSTSPDDQRRAIAATKFNNTVDSFYRGGSRSEDGVEQATNYYIESVARTRINKDDPEIKATMLLPLTINFSTDGISGMRIYNSFTIPEDLLPYSYTVEAGGSNQNATKRVGFIVTGLDHTLQGNTWTTDVKANMYYVKNKDRYKTKSGYQTDGIWKAIAKPVAATAGGSASSGASGGSVGGPVTIGRRTNMASATNELKIIVDKFRAIGLNKAAAAGAAGTMFGESGLNKDAWVIGATVQGGATTVSASSTKGQRYDQQGLTTGLFVRPTYQSNRITAYGIAQWTKQRLDGYVVFVNARGGRSANTYETQVDYVIAEMKRIGTIINRLKNVPETQDGAAQAALEWLDYYEFSKPFVTEQSKRDKRATYGVSAWDIIKNFP